VLKEIAGEVPGNRPNLLTLGLRAPIVMSMVIITTLIVLLVLGAAAAVGTIWRG
jgi:hypothetical protein